MTTAVKVDIAGGVAVVTMCPPGAHNTVSGTLLRDLLHTAEELERDDSVRVVVTAAEGPVWCASASFEDLARHLGSSVDDMLHGTDFAGEKGLPVLSEQGRRFDRLGMGHWVLRYRSLHKPTIAALTGSVAGGGLALAVMHDFRVASEAARFHAAFLSVGVGPEMGLSWFLPRLVGMAAATDMLLTDRKVDAAEALRIGLVNDVVPADEVLPKALALAERLAAMAPLGLRAHVRALRATAEASLREQLELEWDNQRITIASADAKAAAEALLNRTRPDFTGR